MTWPLILADRVQETTTTTGTGAVTLLGAVPGFQSFTVVGNGNSCTYCIADQAGTEWEVGLGTYSTTGPTLSRVQVYASSNAGALVNFATGTRNVFLTESAAHRGGTGEPDQIPLLSNLTWLNQNTATATQRPWGISLSQGNVGGTAQVCGLYQALPATPNQAMARIVPGLVFDNYVAWGLFLYNAASGLLMVFKFVAASGAMVLSINEYGAYSSEGSTLQSNTVCTPCPQWMRIRDDGTTRYFELSSDGYSWVSFYSQPNTTYLTADHAGFFIDGRNFGITAAVHSWYVGP